MIHYQLVCKAQHEFDSWFRSSADFDRQREQGLLTCPTCGCQEVSKALMAPNVSTSKQKCAPRPALQPQAAQKLAQEKIQTLRAHLTEHSEYVGDDFTSVARDIHYGDEPERGIYGEASLKEIKELNDEGIDVLPLPEVLDDKN